MLPDVAWVSPSLWSCLPILTKSPTTWEGTTKSSPTIGGIGGLSKSSIMPVAPVTALRSDWFSCRRASISDMGVWAIAFPIISPTSDLGGISDSSSTSSFSTSSVDSSIFSTSSVDSSSINWGGGDDLWGGDELGDGDIPGNIPIGIPIGVPLGGPFGDLLGGPVGGPFLPFFPSAASGDSSSRAMSLIPSRWVLVKYRLALDRNYRLPR